MRKFLPFYKKINIFTKASEEARDFSRRLKNWLNSYAIESNVFENLAELENDKNIKGTDLLLVVGGDGSLLIATRRVARYRVPMMLRASLIRDGKKILEADVLNDVVVNKAILARIVDVAVYVGDRYITTYNGDGIIIATPNGSTGYALSAGGPIVYPMMEIFLVVPICPHTLTDRPLILPNMEPITIELVHEEKDAWLTLDGQEGTQLRYGDKIVVKQSPYHAYLVRSPRKNYFDILREKLGWK